METPDFIIEDLLDLSNGGGDDMTMTDVFFDTVTGNSTDYSGVTPVDSCNSPVSGHEFSLGPSFPDHFSDELCVPYDEVAELEWLSNFVEESFSSEDLHKFHIIPTGPQHNGPTHFQNPTSSPNPNPNASPTVPGKARSKRSRVAPCDWSTRLLMVAPTSPTTSSTNPNWSYKKTSSKKKENIGSNTSDSEIRRCLHCATEKTPQWRTGPMGPKTLCNACGVRFKSGRLVPEYRPASSPTFISAKHSNSHRKVVELRRQKEVQRHQIVGHQQQHQLMMGVSNGCDDLLIHQHLGSHYHHML